MAAYSDTTKLNLTQFSLHSPQNNFLFDKKFHFSELFCCIRNYLDIIFIIDSTSIM